jgi:hypothetical protein
MTQDEAIAEAISRAESQIQQSTDLPPGELTEYILDLAGETGNLKQAYIVVARPGLAIAAHNHGDDVVIFYARVVDCPLWVADVPILPENGEVLRVPAGVMHEVKPNPGDVTRVSVACRVTTFV